MKRKKIKKKILTDPSIEAEKPIKKLQLSARVRNIHIHFNIGKVTLFEFLNKNGYRNITDNTLLDRNAIELIEVNFKNDREEYEKIHGKKEITFLTSNDTQAPRTNIQIDKSFSTNILNLTENIFQNSNVTIQSQGRSSFLSPFTDNQAINICSKMSNAIARKNAQLLSIKPHNNHEIRYTVHFFAKKALEVYGGKMLTFIYRLRKLRFNKPNTVEIKDYDFPGPSLPLLVFKLGNERLALAFYAKKSRIGHLYESRINAYRMDGTHLGVVDCNGFITSSNTNFKPLFSMFFEKFSNNHFEVFSGVETGHCMICERPLTDPVSARRGIGPICARTFGYIK